jgi:hypothetical protein
MGNAAQRGRKEDFSQMIFDTQKSSKGRGTRVHGRSNDRMFVEGFEQASA